MAVSKFAVVEYPSLLFDEFCGESNYIPATTTFSRASLDEAGGISLSWDDTVKTDNPFKRGARNRCEKNILFSIYTDCRCGKACLKSLMTSKYCIQQFNNILI